MTEQEKDSTSSKGQGRSAAAPRVPVTAVQSATDPEATQRYNEAHVKPGPSAVSEGGTVAFRSGPEPDAKEIDLASLAEQGGSNVVTVPSHIYEEFPAPGAPDRTIRRLLYHANQAVPKAALTAHAARATASKQNKSYDPVTETK